MHYSPFCPLEYCLVFLCVEFTLYGYWDTYSLAMLSDFWLIDANL